MLPLELNITTLLMVTFAGVASIASPCVLPMVPIIVTGTNDDHKYRPLLIVAGLSFSFIMMGVLTSLFAGVVAGVMPAVEKVVGVVVIAFGLSMLMGINVFKKFTFFYKAQRFESKGKWSGLILGITLGIIWIPCVGPMLSGVLAMVATQGQLTSGLILLAFYSLGFSIPMLLAGYASQSFRNKVRFVNEHPTAVRLVSGLLLIGFGYYILTSGMLAIGASF
ncbi:MAG: cytochrome c biogenesis CcdA family protein [Proteobacteria bacterium]|nr:cytochrome c biogenesis CcdA family protein [Pseudomonadota bacterium]MBU1140828.1 cytochrome c biogenesis CcdA family protein [Pseudomonadota bacterium]MBU1234828.1 cytochrome c biogenesis CcdA family protein [Pseudomonadota bacterium]MBU1417693.1 cytochrome c biogenesis CcdA family protein [Pseudomonadota bacterium]MBU1454967.1 cytochrome c biogenesis CcdA family protein [Pseudomonadota bacterium]